VKMRLPNQMTDLLTRARNYVAKLPIAILGERGSDEAFRVAATLVHGFALSESDAMPIMEEYSARCVPPWSRKELEHKLRSAAGWTKHEKPRGHLAGEARQVPAPPPPPRPKKSLQFSWLAREPSPTPAMADSATAACETAPVPEPETADAESRRIAGELARLHAAGAFRGPDDREVIFYAHIIRIFEASFTGIRATPP
jgi:hypothetical protein